MHDAARRETIGKHNIVTDLLDEIERLQNKKHGYVHQTDDGDWYLVPEDETELFLTCIDRFQSGWSADELRDWLNLFDTKFKKYRLSGGVESLSIPMELE
jgi:hypothetical protein